jgi:hypothetical protein
MGPAANDAGIRIELPLSDALAMETTSPAARSRVAHAADPLTGLLGGRL